MSLRPFDLRVVFDRLLDRKIAGSARRGALVNRRHLCKAAQGLAAQGLNEYARDDHNPGDHHGQAGKHQKVIQDTYHPAPPCF
jgi:hypothetical protein